MHIVLLLLSAQLIVKVERTSTGLSKRMKPSYLIKHRDIRIEKSALNLPVSQGGLLERIEFNFFH